MATIRKKACMVGQLADAMYKMYNHAQEVDPEDDSDEELEDYCKRLMDISKKMAALREVCEVDDKELLGIMKVIVRQYIDSCNKKDEA